MFKRSSVTSTSITNDTNDHQYDKNNIILSITVTRGDMINKPKGGTKLYQAYEINIKFKNCDLPSYSVAKVFDYYRDFERNLRNLGVSIPVPFPPSFTAGKFGRIPDEDFLSNRCFVLNTWMSVVCAHCFTWNSIAQDLLFTFLSINIAFKGEEEMIVCLLKSGAVMTKDIESSSPLLSRSNNGATAGTGTGTAGATAGAMNHLKQMRQNRRSSLNVYIDSSTSTNVNAAVTSPSSINITNTSTSTSIDDGTNDNMTVVSGVTGISTLPRVLRQADFPSFAKQLNGFMAVTLSMIDAGGAGGKLKIVYKSSIVLKSVPSAQASTSPITTAVTQQFKTYRTFYETLCKIKGYVSHAAFPGSYSKSSIGVSLSTQELTQRAQQLHTWIYTLLHKYIHYTNDIQHCILQFFNIDDGNDRDIVSKSILIVLNTLDTTMLPSSPVTVSLSGISTVTNSNDATDLKSVFKKEVSSSGSVASTGDNSSIAGEMSGDSPSPVLLYNHIYACVKYGQLSPKSKTDSKLHVTYKTSLMLAHTDALEVTDTYSSYRSLYDQLLSLNAVMSLPFPGRHAKSSLGIGLTAVELSGRLTALHEWVIEILRNFPFHPILAQRAIVDFLGLESLDNQGAVAVLTALDINKSVAFIMVEKRDSFNTSVTAMCKSKRSIVDIYDDDNTFASASIYDILHVTVSIGHISSSTPSTLITTYKTKLKVVMDTPSLLSPVEVTYPLSKYLLLKQKLQSEYNIYVPVPFPDESSSLILSTSMDRNKLENQAAILHRWLLSLLLVYYTLTSDAQSLIKGFFTIDPDDVFYQARNKIIIAALMRLPIPSIDFTIDTYSNSINSSKRQSNCNCTVS